MPVKTKIRDLRDWLDVVADLGQLKVVENAEWHLEIGTISELNYQKKGHKALLFDRIKGYPAGYRVLTASTGTPERVGITFNLGLPHSDQEVVDLLRGKPGEWDARAREFPPVFVDGGPVFENSLYGEDVDLSILPAPFWHELDGGRYLGTGCECITQDPDTGWVNLGAYRGMVVDRDKMTVQIIPGKHGAIHLQKWFEQQGRAPMAVSLGNHPLLSCLSGLEVPTNVSEYEYAGAILGEPVAVIKAPVTGLPIPARSEIVLEGYLEPGNTADEGPYGEWTGYYSGSEGPVIYLHVQAMHFRNNPIIMGMPPGMPPFDYSYMRTVLKSAMIYDALMKAGASEVKGVWAPECGGGRLLVNVAIRQRYCGHAKQVGLLTTTLQAAAYMNRYVVVVDDDIDPTNLEEVIWAMCTRTDPSQDIQTLNNMWGSVRDPMLADFSRQYMSRAVIDACIPYERKQTFPKVARSSPELLQNMREKWRSVWE